MTTKPNHIPSTVGQALAWLGKMNIAYRYIKNINVAETNEQ